ESNRGAVAFCRPMENAARLYHRQNHPQKNAQAPDTGGLFTRLTAVFRMINTQQFDYPAEDAAVRTCA
ncbi:MAG TPA: hypothetical protein VI320_01760, partial [Terracidiphilus sp.]